MLTEQVDHYTAYAMTNIRAEWLGWQGVRLRVGSDDAVKVWLNGDEVHIHRGLRSSDGYQDEIFVNLNLGDNLLMVKVSDHDRDWRLFVGLDVPVHELASIKVEIPNPNWDWKPTDSEVKNLPVKIVPDPPISEVAFGKESTYFVFTIKYPKFSPEFQGAVIYGNCVIMLDMEGVPGFTEGYQANDKATDKSLSNEPVYFMFPLIDKDDPSYSFPKDENFADLAGDIAKKGVIIGSGYVAGRAVVKKLAGKTVRKTVKLAVEVAAALVGAAISEIIEFLLNLGSPDKPDQTAFIEDPSFTLPVPGDNTGWTINMSRGEYLFMINNTRLKGLDSEWLEKITISVVQPYRLVWEETPDKPASIYFAEYENTFNLGQIFHNETGQMPPFDISETEITPAAPRSRPMLLSDYPPFQQLPPEIQEFLLRHFGELGSMTDWQIPEATSLLPNYPNPFNPETWLPYQLSEPADVTLTIHDIQGRVVRDLDLGHQRAGMYHSRSSAAHWDGRNAVGEPVASGLYFYTLKAGDFAATRKMLIRK